MGRCKHIKEFWTSGLPKRTIFTHKKRHQVLRFLKNIFRSRFLKSRRKKLHVVRKKIQRRKIRKQFAPLLRKRLMNISPLNRRRRRNASWISGNNARSLSAVRNQNHLYNNVAPVPTTVSEEQGDVEMRDIDIDVDMDCEWPAPPDSSFANSSFMCDEMAQYKLLYKINPNLAIREGKNPINISKNRYTHILPYDYNRVILLNSSSGNYINASYVKMNVSPKEANHYIATQGPLGNTTEDFWRMVQQEKIHLIVMLTDVGYKKCNQYWPGLGYEFSFPNGFLLTCLKVEPDITGSFVCRDLIYFDRKIGEKRRVQHIQFLAWPDSGIPPNTNLFLKFIKRVRSARHNILVQEIEEYQQRNHSENVSRLQLKQYVLNNVKALKDKFNSARSPRMIVHCAGGVGRSGVFICMDTVFSLIESKLPVNPLHIVQTMRDQRPYMIRKAKQFKFLWECIRSVCDQNNYNFGNCGTKK